jgi:hypothetical protein
MDKDKDLELIIDYINGDLSTEQIFHFEERLTQEIDLVESLRIQKEIRLAFLRLRISGQVKSTHEVAEILEQDNPLYSPEENSNKVQAGKLILRKIAAVFISMIFIGSLWAWFNLNSGDDKSIVNNVTPNINDSTYLQPKLIQDSESNNPIVNDDNPVKNDSIYLDSKLKKDIERNNQNKSKDSNLRRIGVVQLNPDVNFAFSPKTGVSKEIFYKRIRNTSNSFNSMYKLNKDSLFLYLKSDSYSDEVLFEVKQNDDSQSTLENGFYLMFDNNFYRLENNNKLNTLILLENKSRLKELNKLIKKK